MQDTSLEFAIETIVDHFNKYAKNLDAPLHAEKSNDELIDMGFSGKITKAEYDNIIAWKDAQKESPEATLRKQINELVLILKPVKTKGASERLTTQNKFVFDKLGLKYISSYSKNAISKTISKHGKDRKWRTDLKKDDEKFFAALVELVGSKEKLIAAIEAEMAAQQKKTK